MSKNENLSIFTNGILRENPVLRLMLGTCPTLAVSTAASNGIGMGLAATAVLVCSNAAISLLRKFIPDKVRIPAFITIIMMPLAYSISDGILLGMISYVALNICCGNHKKITPTMYVLAILFILKYIFI